MSEMSEEIGPQIPANLLSKFQGNTNDNCDTSKQQWEESKSSHDPERRNSQHNIQIGPQIPLSTEIDLNQETEEDPDAYLPALPPDLLAERQRKKAAKLVQNVDSQRKGAANPRRRPIGPTLPRPTEYSNFDEEEDVIIGPILPKDISDIVSTIKSSWSFYIYHYIANVRLAVLVSIHVAICSAV
ncbi:21219_t:CDS:1 [Gigaspora rosea]|nr:21219_t:CDS:1 [Gigaspora rosea]